MHGVRTKGLVTMVPCKTSLTSALVRYRRRGDVSIEHKFQDWNARIDVINTDMNDLVTVDALTSTQNPYSLRG